MTSYYSLVIDNLVPTEKHTMLLLNMKIPAEILMCSGFSGCLIFPKLISPQEVEIIVPGLVWISKKRGEALRLVDTRHGDTITTLYATLEKATNKLLNRNGLIINLHMGQSRGKGKTLKCRSSWTLALLYAFCAHGHEVMGLLFEPTE